MLTDQAIQKLKATDKPKKYTDGGGLFLFIPTSGKKFWRMAYRYEKKAKLLSFGEYPQISLRVARQRRDEAKKLLKEGIDPSKHKKAVGKSTDTTSFRAVALEWHERQTLHCQRTYRIFLLNNVNKYLFPFFGDKAMSDVTTEDVIAALEPLQQSGELYGGRTMAQICGQICRYAVATGKAVYDATEKMPSSIWPRQKGYRTSLLDSEKLGHILLNLEQHNGYFPVNCALRLIPLLFVRSKELRCAQWKEFDFSNKLWVIPAERMVTNHEHVVPLASQSIKILKELQEYSGRSVFLFPGVRSYEKPISQHTTRISLRKRGYDNMKLTFEGTRALAARLLSDLGFEREIIALQLSQHNERVRFDSWQRLSERKNMMQEWANYLYLLRDKALQEKTK